MGISAAACSQASDEDELIVDGEYDNRLAFIQ
jgi:hypothetical protein